MQILLQRIKWDKKENIIFINAIEMPGTEVRSLIEPEEEDGITIKEHEPQEENNNEEEETELSPKPPEIEDIEYDSEDV